MTLLERLRGWAGLGPQSALSEPLEPVIRGLLEQYAGEIEADLQRSGSPGWILRPAVNHGAYLRTILQRIADARAEGVRIGRAEASRTANWTCVCRCKKHGKAACVLCLHVYGCPLHSEVGPEHLRPDVLQDAEELARLVHATYCEVVSEQATEPAVAPLRWDQNPEDYRLVMIETMRRAVCTRLADQGRR